MNELEQVEDYLDALQSRLFGSPRQIRRLLWETETHLYDAVEAAMAAGSSQLDAERMALARFGSVEDVIAASRTTSMVSWREVVRRLAAQLLPVTAIGLMAIGLSGFVARLMVAVWGKEYVFADAPRVMYSPANCERWTSLHPQALDCVQAYVAESMHDDLLVRYAAGVVGVLLAVALLALRTRRPRWVAPSAMLVSITAAVAFGGAGLALGVAAADQARVAADHGTGQWLSAAIVAIPVGLFYLWRFARLAGRDGGGSFRELITT